jgi:ABC-type dipeptide/oligopeptide/nickel transport system permease subunit
MRLRYAAVWLGFQTPLTIGLAALVLGLPVGLFLGLGITLGVWQAVLTYWIAKNNLAPWPW